MRRIAVINQKGGVGKTTTVANLGAALARAGRRVVVVDLDPQANLTLHLGHEPTGARQSIYSVLAGEVPFGPILTATGTEGLWLAPSHIDLAGAELELAGKLGRETILAEAIDAWENEAAQHAAGDGPLARADYLLIDCPPSLGLLSVNGLVASREVFIAMQTEFFALQGMSKLVSVIELLRRRIRPELELTGIVPCLYDTRLRLAREVLAEIREYFPSKVFRSAVHTNVKLAEAPSYGRTIFEYAPTSRGARDHEDLAREVLAQEAVSPAHADGVAVHAEGLRAAERMDTPEAGAPDAGELRAEARVEPAPLPTYDYGHYLGEGRAEVCGHRGPGGGTERG